MTTFLPITTFLTALLISTTAAALAHAAEPAAAVGLTYQPPRAKQGLADAYTPLDMDLAPRYAAMTKLGVGMKIYNYFWAGLEGFNIPSSTTPMSCNGETMLVPANAQDQARLGFHRFHCYSRGWIAHFDAMLKLDQRYGLQSIAVMFYTPPLYRVPGCVASADGLDVGCVPDDSHMDDYEDYVNFLASRYNGANNVGKLSHFIVWNEVSNGTWFNYSPVVDVRHALLSPSLKARWINKYVDMFRRSQNAVGRHGSDSLVHTSLNLFLNKTQPTDGRIVVPEIGGQAVLDGLWSQIGTSAGWSVAVHPYEEPLADLGPNTMNFFGLKNLANYQNKQLRALGSKDPNNAQQAKILCSEQSWANTPLSRRAGNICKAHSVVMAMPTVLGTTHTFFQSVNAVDDARTFIPLAAGPLLQNNPAQYPTYQAYQSTGPNVWGKANNHYCCQQYNLGCLPTVAPPLPPSPDVIGSIDGISQTSQGPVLSGWACNVRDPDPIYIHVYLGGAAGAGTFAAQVLPGLPSEPAIATACQSSGKSYRFLINLAPWHASKAGQTIYIHGLSSGGGPNKLLTNSGKFTVP